MAPPDDLRPRLSPPPRHQALAAPEPVAGPVHLADDALMDAPTRDRLVALVRAHGLALAATASEAKTVIRTLPDPTLAAEPGGATPPADATPPPTDPEAHALAIDRTGGTTTIRLGARDPRGIALAVRTLAQVWTDAGLPAGRVVDWPGAAVRGLIEGFYGEPWTHQARLGMLGFLGAHKFNTYVYAPKDDPFHRDRWRQPYPDDRFAQIVELLECCTAEGLRFVYSLAPGLDLTYSSPDDLKQILGKYRTLFDAGVRHFGLYFDDIPYVFLDEADVQVYGAATLDDYAPLGRAQADLTARVYEALLAWDPACSLIFCPVEYYGPCESDYVSALRTGLPTEVDVFYTGPQVCSPRLESDYTRAVSARFGRPVVFWDNYPVNDAAMTGRLHCNPVVGRDPDLFDHARGLICNPMTQCEASKLAVGTIGEYCWWPERYDPAAAFERAALALVDPAELPHLQRFAENMHFCCLHETESEALQADIAALQAARPGPGAAPRAKALRDHFTRLAMSARALARLSNAALREEMAPWVDALQTWSDLGRAALGVLNAPPERIGEERRYLERELGYLERTSEVETCGEVVAAFVRWALEQTG